MKTPAKKMAGAHRAQLQTEYDVALRIRAARAVREGIRGQPPSLDSLIDAATMQDRGTDKPHFKTVNGYIQWLIRQVGRGLVETDMPVLGQSIGLFYWAKKKPALHDGKNSIWDYTHWNDLVLALEKSGAKAAFEKQRAARAALVQLRAQTIYALNEQEKLRIVVETPEYMVVIPRSMQGEQFIGESVNAQGCTVEREGDNATYFYLSHGPIIDVVGKNGRPSFNLHFAMGRHDNPQNRRVPLGHIFGHYPELPEQLAHFFANETGAIPYDLLPFLSWHTTKDLAKDGVARLLVGHFVGAGRLITDRVMCHVKNSKAFLPLRELNKWRKHRRHARRLARRMATLQQDGLPETTQRLHLVRVQPREINNIPVEERTDALYRAALLGWRETCLAAGVLNPAPRVPATGGDAMAAEAGIRIDAQGRLQIEGVTPVKVTIDGFPAGPRRGAPLGARAFVRKAVLRALNHIR